MLEELQALYKSDFDKSTKADGRPAHVSFLLETARKLKTDPVAQFVLYRLRRDLGTHGRLLTAILDAVVRDDPVMRAERDRATERSRSHTSLRVEEPPGEKPMIRAKRPE